MKISERVFTGNGLILWLVLSSAFCGTGAVLKSLYAEDLCYWSDSTKLNLKFQNSAILSSVPNGPLDCQITLEPEQGSSIVIAFYQYTLGPDDSLTFRDRHNFQLSLGGEGFFLDERKSLLFDGPLIIHYVTNNTQGPNRLKFQLVFTQVHDAPCELHEFKCRNNKCITKDLACDRHNHCGDGSGQEDCSPKDSKTEDLIPRKEVKSPWPIVILIGIVILGIAVIAITAVLIRGCVLRKKKSQQPQLPTVAAAPEVQQAAAPSVSGSMRPPVRSGHQRTAHPLQIVPDSEYTPQNYEIPSMYPHIPSVPDSSGVDNPEFKSEE